MAATEETGQVTGTKDKDYNLLWFTEQSLANALRLETYIQDAERAGDSELADLFRRAQAESDGRDQGDVVHAWKEFGVKMAAEAHFAPSAPQRAAIRAPDRAASGLRLMSQRSLR